MATDWQIGERIEKRWEIYKILGGPGKSGMGIVYVVYDHEWREPFAVKTFQDEVFARNPGVADRFTLEARTWVNLDSHQNVVQAKFVENIRGKPFLFLEYVSGGDLSGWVGTPRLTKDLPQVLRFAIQFCDGMHHALSKGIQTHRDIKPQNCLVTENNNLKVTDFGLAKVFDDTLPDAAPAASSVAGLGIHISRTGQSAGTCTHMAPEQFADAKHVDVRADIYSFGVMLFQMVTGRLPFEGRTWEDYARLHSKAAPPPLESGQSALDTIVRKCLAKTAAERYAGFGTLREELAGIYESMTKQPAPKPASGMELDAFELINKGTALGSLGRSEEELACVDRALALNPQFAEAWHNKGAALVRLGRHEEALACVDRALALNSRYAEAWYNKGATLVRLGRYEEALVCFDRALAVNPRYAGAWYNKGATLVRLGRYEEALVCCDHALAVNPRYAQAWYNKGVVLGSLGRSEKALACHDRAIALNPQLAEAWTNKGLALGSLGRSEEQLACHDRAIALNPQLAEAWTNKGVALGSLGRYEEELTCYDRAIALNPQDANNWNNKGVALRRLGRYEEALACHDRAIALNPQHADNWYNKGVALERLGRSEEQLACVDRALALNPRYAQAWYNKGVILAEEFSNAREAIPCFEKAQRLGHPNAAQAIAMWRELLGG
jgi:tetratricopeptide (TPR) repeat protein